MPFANCHHADLPSNPVASVIARKAMTAGAPERSCAWPAAHQAAPHLDTLFELLVPKSSHVRASQTIRSITLNRASSIMPLSAGMTCPWVCFDTRAFANVILIDVDHDDGAGRAEQLARHYGLPRPVVVQDPWSGRSHVFFRLRTAVFFGTGARRKPQGLWRLAGRLLASAMKGTFLPRGSLAKNPWGLATDLIGSLKRRTLRPALPVLYDAHVASRSPLLWVTLPGDGQTYELKAIVAALSDDFVEESIIATLSRTLRKHYPEPSNLGRNCHLFDCIRAFAYKRVERDGGLILDEARRLNAIFSVPLPSSEVRATARSVTCFMNTRYRPRHAADNRRGRDQLEGMSLAPRDRQALAGRVSASARSAATEAKISAAVLALNEVGRPLTQRAVASQAKLGVNTVARRWDRLRNPPIAALSDISPCHVASESVGATMLPASNPTAAIDATVATAPMTDAEHPARSTRLRKRNERWIGSRCRHTRYQASLHPRQHGSDCQVAEHGGSKGRSRSRVCPTQTGNRLEQRPMVDTSKHGACAGNRPALNVVDAIPPPAALGLLRSCQAKVVTKECGRWTGVYAAPTPSEPLSPSA